MQTVASITYSRGIEDAWSKVATFVPKFIAFLIVLIVGYLVAKAIAKLVDKALERVGFDRAVERGGIKRALERSKYDASAVVGRIIFYTLFLFVLELAFGLFGHNPVSDLLTRVVAFLPKLLMAVLIVVIAAAIATAVREIIVTALGELSYAKALGAIASISILVVGFFAAADEIKIAPDVFNTLFTGLVVALVGSTIVAVGGAGIQSLRQYWERSLSRIEQESDNIRQAKEGSADRLKARAEDLKSQAQQAAGGSSGTRPREVRGR